MSGRLLTILLAACCSMAPAQTATGKMPKAEQEELRAALSDASSSTVDLVRVLEAFLARHPDTSDRADIERTLFRAAVELKDDRRIARYGELELQRFPHDPDTLGRTAQALLVNPTTAAAARALQYAKTLESVVENIAKGDSLSGRGAAQKKEDIDRALSRAFLLQARASLALHKPEAAAQLADRSFQIYPTEEAAREAAKGLAALGRYQEAATRFADAFTVPDPRATADDRTVDRIWMGRMYRQEKGSEAGLGDIVLQEYDRTSALVARRNAELRKLDPNAGLTDPMQFTLPALDGPPLPMSTLLGRVIVMDFWATWCEPCREQHPLYDEVKKRFEKRPDVVFLAIATDEDRTVVGPFLDKQKWSRKVYFEDGLSRLLKVSSIPSTIIIDKQGRIASRMNGFLADRFAGQLTSRIEELLR